jgi:hypothetical protein
MGYFRDYKTGFNLLNHGTGGYGVDDLKILYLFHFLKLLFVHLWNLWFWRSYLPGSNIFMVM